MRSPARRSRCGVLPGGLLLAGLLALPGPLAGQGVLDRTPNLSGGWAAETGAVHFHFLHRFWTVDANADDKLVNSPTLLLAAPLPGRTLVGFQYATNSLVTPTRFNEWEVFGRWAPSLPGDSPLEAGLTVAYNTAAESGDGELALALPVGPLRLLGSARAFSDLAGSGEAGWGASGGAVFRVRNGLALAADVGTVWSDGNRGETAWGAGVQMRIPATPHTFSIQATNTRTGTLQGASLRDESRGGTLWGFEFTIPFTLSRYLPRGSPERSAQAPPAERPGDGTVVVTMTEDLRFAPETLEVNVGDTVVWRNTTPLVHTVTADPEVAPDPEQVVLPDGAEPFDSGDMEEGDEFRQVFTVPGRYLYVCTPHSMVGMVGEVVVRAPESTGGEERPFP